MQLQRSEGLMLFISLVMTAFIFIAVAGQRFIPALPYIEVGGSLGWNWFSLLCVLFMAAFSVVNSVKIAAPFSSRKLLTIISIAVFPLLFYYTLIDMFPRILSVSSVYIIRGVNPDTFIANYFIWITFNNPLPSNLIAFFAYAAFTLTLARELIDFKYVPLVFALTAFFNAVAVFFFGDFNLRLISSSDRIVAYYATFIPGWLATTCGYVLFWRKRK